MILDKLMYIHLDQIKANDLTPIDLPLNPPDSLNDSDRIVCPRMVPGWKASYQFDVSSSDTEASFVPPQVSLELEKDVPTFSDYSELPIGSLAKNEDVKDHEKGVVINEGKETENSVSSPDDFLDKPLFT